MKFGVFGTEFDELEINGLTIGADVISICRSHR